MQEVVRLLVSLHFIEVLVFVEAGTGRLLLWKELLGGLTNGLAIALGTFLVVILWSGSFGLGLVIGLAMIVNMTVAVLAGAGVPLLLRMMGRDPAQSSAIFMTTITDILGIASFLGFAVLFKPMLV